MLNDKDVCVTLLFCFFYFMCRRYIIFIRRKN
jgi:hypothetical protein